MAHVLSGSNKTSITVKPCGNKQVIMNRQKHNDRNYKTGHEWVDERRSSWNIQLVGEKGVNPFAVAMEKVTGEELTHDELSSIRKYERDDAEYKEGRTEFDYRYSDGSKMRTDAATNWDAVMSYPGEVRYCSMDADGKLVEHPELIGQKLTSSEMQFYKNPETGNMEPLFHMPVNEDEFKRWQQITVDFMKDWFGKDNIISAVVHMDETSPHIHMIGTPVCEKENGVRKFNYHFFVDGKFDLSRMQTEYAEALSELGYERGTEGSGAVQVDPQYAKRVMEGAHKELPTTLEAAQSRILELESSVGHLELKLMELKRNGEALSKERQRNNRNHDKHQEIERRQREEIERLTKQLQKYSTERQILEALFAGIRRQEELDKEYIDALLRGINQLTEQGLKDLKARDISLPELEAMLARGTVSGSRLFNRNGLVVDLDFDGHDDRTEVDDPLTVEREDERKEE